MRTQSLLSKKSELEELLSEQDRERKSNAGSVATKIPDTSTSVNSSKKHSKEAHLQVDGSLHVRTGPLSWSSPGASIAARSLALDSAHIFFN